jgi:Tfp pilus assembly protein PilO
MNNRTITFTVLGVVLVVAVWWMFVFSGVRTDSSNVDKDIDAAKTAQSGLETELSQLEDLEANAPQTEARLEQLRKLVPQQADLASFIDEANELGVSAGVDWVSISPTAPTSTGAVNTISFTMTVSGGYFQVLDYLNRLENTSRLVVTDGVTIEPGGTDPEASGPPKLTADITARMFSQGTVPPSATSTDPSAPVDPTAPIGSGVNGGVAAGAMAGMTES